MPNNHTSLNEVIQTLTSGENLEWQEHSDYSSGSIALNSAKGRKLFEYLASCEVTTLEEMSEDILQGLINTWQKENSPAETTTTSLLQSLVEGLEHTASDNETITNLLIEPLLTESWKLDEIITHGFGGLNQFDGPFFKIKINQETWCIEGQNGSGKTSLTSAIIWALTGNVIREHSGLIQNIGERKPVFSNSGTKIGTWPPLAAYPTSESDLNKTAKVFVKLTFKNTNGDKAVVYRRIRSAADGSVSHREKFSDSLKPHIHLIEAGVVMPNRLGHLGFGKRSENLCDAVKMLTGLDYLESIGQGVAKIKRGNSRFLNYAKQQRIDDIKKEYFRWLKVAESHAEATGYDLSAVSQIGADDLAEKLEEVRTQAEKDATEKMNALVIDLASNIDTGTQQGRDKVKQAVERIKADISKLPTNLSSMFSALATLSEAKKNNGFAPMNTILESVESELQIAIEWHKKKIEDPKLQFKAEASLWVSDTVPSNCPLCEAEFITPEQEMLATELSQLKINGGVAKKELTDVCNAISTKITNAIPRVLRSKLQQLDNPDIKGTLLGDIRSSFIDTPSFAVVEGLKKLLENETQNNWTSLSAPPSYVTETINSNEPKCVQNVRQQVKQTRHMLSIAEWWASSRADYWEFWKNTIGQPISNGDDLSFPNSIIGKRLEKISNSLSTAKPFDETASALKNAIEKEAKWREINEHQEMRQSIVDTIAPLAQLINFVNAETSRSIDSLSSRIGNVLKRIHLHERLDYKDTSFEKARKSTVNVHGSFNGGDFKIDATLVANTSWLRAILWAFIFSLREEIVTTLGFNPFPLVVMDDPQVTFDPRNEGLWASEIVRLSNTSEPEQAQFIVTTHEVSFFKTLVEINKDFSGQHARIVSVTDEHPVAHIENHSHLERLWEKAKKGNDDTIARSFIESLRVYLESTLRYLLRGEGGAVRGELLSPLIQRMKRLSDNGTSPFERDAIKTLVNKLTGESTRISKIQDAHHRHTQGVPDAIDLYENFWNKLEKHLHNAFVLMADFRAFQGDHRLYTTHDNVIALPIKQKEDIRQLRIVDMGIAAAARTDGRSGDGLVTLNELENAPEIQLNNHDVFRLVAQTLEPVANIGDFLIVRNTPIVENRCLVVAGYDNRLLARRYSEPEEHPFTSVLSAQSVNPSETVDPILVSPNSINAKMVVGTLFNRDQSISPSVESNEVISVEDVVDYRSLLENSRLFKVQGQSAEPIALDGQYLITGEGASTQQEMREMDGMLVIAADSEGTRYFKRMRLSGNAMIILESLNPDGFDPSILASFDESTNIHITSLLPVNGVMFEIS